jgi:hypothetical protein
LWDSARWGTITDDRLKSALQRTIRVALVAIAGATLVAPATSAPASISVRGPARLAHVTVFEGATGSVPLVVEERAIMTGSNRMTRAGGPNAEVSIRHDGLFAGILIVPEAYVGAPQDDRWLLVAQFDTCDRPPCPKTSIANVLYPGGKTIELLPGRYRAYFLSDDRARIRLEFRNLRGKATVEPSTASSSSVASPVAPASLSEGVTSWAAGQDYVAGRTGLRLALLSFEAPDYQGGGIGICHYANGAPPPPQIAYGPHCTAVTRATGAGSFTLGPPQGEDENYLYVSGTTYHDETIGGENGNLTGTHGLGAWITSPGTVRDIRHAGAFFVIEE